MRSGSDHGWKGTSQTGIAGPPDHLASKPMFRQSLVTTVRIRALSAALLLVLFPTILMSQTNDRPRSRDIGLEVGVFSPGPLNAITDVAGVLVGQVTVWEGDEIRTGVTAILPHGGNVFREKVPAAVVVGNGFGKLAGVTQIQELGEIETPILLTCTLCVWRAADAMVEWLLEQEGMGNVRSINPVVGETNDGGLNDIRSRPIRPEHVREALEGASGGTRGRRSRRGRHRHPGLRMEGRHRYQQQGSAWRVGGLHGGCPGAIQLRWSPIHQWRPVGKELGQFAYQRYVGETASRASPDPVPGGSPGQRPDRRTMEGESPTPMGDPS